MQFTHIWIHISFETDPSHQLACSSQSPTLSVASRSCACMFIYNIYKSIVLLKVLHYTKTTKAQSTFLVMILEGWGMGSDGRCSICFKGI